MKQILYLLIFTCACSVPNLESPECSQAREQLKDFYSYHFADDMSFSSMKLQNSKKYLTKRFASELELINTTADVFTSGDNDFPKAFRIGKCELVNPDKAEVEVLLFWKDESRTEQRKIKVITIRENNNWLIDRIER
ncbi:MAG: DUF3828 domain-containing protein [Acidobacteria bacterium]|nr:MAG: DUF3828 domain-containing protein [Acidobacteriota bacterium]